MSTLFDTMRKPKVEDDDASDTDTQNDTGEGGTGGIEGAPARTLYV